MFINSKKSFEIREGESVFTIPLNYIGEIPAWVAAHWLVRAAIKDGSIATPEYTADKALEKADGEAAEKADSFDKRPEISEVIDPPKNKEKGKDSR